MARRRLKTYERIATAISKALTTHLKSDAFADLQILGAKLSIVGVNVAGPSEKVMGSFGE